MHYVAWLQFHGLSVQLVVSELNMALTYFETSNLKLLSFIVTMFLCIFFELSSIAYS